MKQHLDQQAKNREISMGQAGCNSRVPYQAALPMQQSFYPGYMNGRHPDAQAMPNAHYGTVTATTGSVCFRMFVIFTKRLLCHFFKMGPV